MSLRILLHATSAAAGRHRRGIHPVLSVSVDHYVRIFVRVFRSPKAALASAKSNVSYVLQSEECPSFFLVPALPQVPDAKRTNNVSRLAPTDKTVPSLLQDSVQISEHESNGSGGIPGISVIPPPGGVCPETGGHLILGGPMWSGPLHDQEWVNRAIELASEIKADSHRALENPGDASSTGGNNRSVRGRRLQSTNLHVPRLRLSTRARVDSLLKAISRELPDVPLFYSLRDMSATLGLAKHPQRDQVMLVMDSLTPITSVYRSKVLYLRFLGGIIMCRNIMEAHFSPLTSHASCLPYALQTS